MVSCFFCCNVIGKIYKWFVYALMFANPPTPLSRYLCLLERATVRVRDVMSDTGNKNTGTRAEEAAALLRVRLQSLTVPSLQVAEREGRRERRREGASERWSQRERERERVRERERERARARAGMCVWMLIRHPNIVHNLNTQNPKPYDLIAQE
jgi:hypothetical protein